MVRVYENHGHRFKWPTGKPHRCGLALSAEITGGWAFGSAWAVLRLRVARMFVKR